MRPRHTRPRSAGTTDPRREQRLDDQEDEQAPGQLVPQLAPGRREQVRPVARAPRRPRSPAASATPSTPARRAEPAGSRAGRGSPRTRPAARPGGPPPRPPDTGPIGEYPARRSPRPGRVRWAPRRAARPTGPAARPSPGGVRRALETCCGEWTTRRIRSPAVTVLANEVGRAVPLTASRIASTKLGSIGQSLPARSAVVVQSRTRPFARDPLDHRGRPSRVVPAGQHADATFLGLLVHRHDLAGRDPLQRRGLQLQQHLQRRRPDRLDDQPADRLVDQRLQGAREDRILRPREQVVIESRHRPWPR